MSSMEPDSPLSGDAITLTLPHRSKSEQKFEENNTSTIHQDADKDQTTKNGITTEPVAQEQTIPVKKKKKKSRGRKGKKRVTGFEEYYVDAPITPAEYAEEKKIYDASKPAIQRLETAIQRYQTKRRLDSDRMNVFTKYMSYGGVDVGPKMFQGNDPRDLDGMDAEDIVTATAESNIPRDRTDWKVDFERVAKGFFSSALPQTIALDTEKLVELATHTIKNFLNYILYHDVCPEYKDNILAARRVCDKATVELWKAQQSSIWAPGDFNMACSTLFGGSYFDSYTEDEEWSADMDSTSIMPLTTARKVVKFALAGAGDYEQAVKFRDLANANKLESKCVHEDGFEITAITPPSLEIKSFYKDQAADLKPVGKLRAISWRNPGLPGYDLPPGEKPTCQLDGDENNNQKSAGAKKFEFFVEESVLQFCFVGMKVDSRVWELNCGIHYFEKVLTACCSFYTVLPNESMVGWKEPRDLRDDYLLWEPKNNNDEEEVGVDA